MDIRELVARLQRVRCWTHDPTARQLLDEMINHFKAQIPQ
jgi:hypothetical protein